MALPGASLQVETGPGCEISQKPTKPGTSPSLPSEILLEIFAWACINPLNTWYTLDIPEGRTAAILSTVCHYWRGLVISTPSLWTSIRVFIPCNSTLQEIYSLVRLYLHMSGDKPLSVVWHCELDSPALLRRARLILSLLHDNCHRWEKASILMPVNEWKGLFSECSFDALTFIEFTPLFNFLSTPRVIAPKLQAMGFRGEIQRWPQKLPGHLWGSLTSLHFTFRHFSPLILPMLSASPALKCLTLSSFTFPAKVTIEPATSFLDTLTVIHVKSRDLVNLFRFLKTPRLRRLELYGQRSGCHQLSLEIAEVVRALKRNLETPSLLRELVLKGLEIGEVELVKALSTLSTLTSLTLYEVLPEDGAGTIGNDFLLGLTDFASLDRSRPCQKNLLLPNLEHLELRAFVQKPGHCIKEGLVQMIRSRYHPHRDDIHEVPVTNCLRSIALSLAGQESPNFIHELKDLREEGLKVIFFDSV
ncbi:hypothetical protein VKT23_013226 [Stygiomarasmius scandens]|uniref:F-box domain-containing protein n=1 Tax=Marasmiellus scandens TaxID=2682957 RepID=A0ABR1J416_9AGAR